MDLRRHRSGAEADPGPGRELSKTQGSILDRIKRKTLFRMWAVMVFTTGCSHVESRDAKRKALC